MNTPKIKSIYLPFDPEYPSLPYGSASIEISHGPVEFSIRIYHKPDTDIAEYVNDLERLREQLLASYDVVQNAINAVGL